MRISRLIGSFIFLAVLLYFVGLPSNLLHAQSGTHGVTLTWTAPASGGAAATYNVKRGATTGAETTIGATTAPVVNYTDTTGMPGATYFYVVTAVNATGESLPSNEVSATFLVPLAVPGPPTGLVAASK